MNKNDIRLLTCNNLLLHITSLKKIKPPSWSRRRRWKNCKAILPAKAILHAKFDARRQPKSKIKRAPDWSNQIITIYLIGQFKPVKWYDIISLVKWYHSTSRLSFLFTALSHWYIHTIYNKGCYLGLYHCHSLPSKICHNIKHAKIVRLLQNQKTYQTNEDSLKHLARYKRASKIHGGGSQDRPKKYAVKISIKRNEKKRLSQSTSKKE